MTMLEEIDQQPDVVARVLANNRRLMADARALASDPSHVVIAARGTSDNAARYAQYVWGARNRLPVGLTTPSLFGPLQSPPRLDDALVVGISQSGQSPDLVEVLMEAENQNCPTIAITNYPDSPLGQTADLVVDLSAGVERAVAATKTYTAELTVVALLSLAFSDEPTTALEQLPDVVATAVSNSNLGAEAVAGLVDSEGCVVVGRGFHQATIHEWALKLQELTYLLAQPFSAADFLHGPIAVVEADFPVLAVTTSGPTLDQMTELLDKLNERGAHVVTLTDVSASGDVVIPIPKVEPWLSPIAAAPAVQRFAHVLTTERGFDPEVPRGLSKVTRTR